MYFVLLDITSQDNTHPVTSTIILFSLLSLSSIKCFSCLADKLTLGKASSRPNKVIESVLSIGCRKLPNTGHFRISTQIKSLFSLSYECLGLSLCFPFSRFT